MAAYCGSSISAVTLPTVPYKLPPVIDDVSLAFSLGIRAKTLWWAVLGSRRQAGTPGSLYAKAGILKRGRAGRAGKIRAIHIPDPRLKNIQRAVCSAFVKPIPVGVHVRAYEPGVKPLDTAQALSGSKVLLSLDLKNFFGSIRSSWIREYFMHLGYSRQVSNLLAQLCCCTDKGANPTTPRLVRFLPQGTVVSPTLANRVADFRLDAGLLALAGAAGWSYSRYSDNLYFGTDSLVDRVTTDAFKHSILTCIGRSGWKAHKIKVTPFWRRQAVLGAVVNERPNMPQEEYAALRGLIHNCFVHGFASQLEVASKRLRQDVSTEEKLISHIRGKLAYVKALLVDSRYNKLASEFASATEAYRVRQAAAWAAEDAIDASEA